MSRTPVRSENPPLPNLEEGGFVWLRLRLVIAAAATAAVTAVIGVILGRSVVDVHLDVLDLLVGQVTSGLDVRDALVVVFNLSLGLTDFLTQSGIGGLGRSAPLSKVQLAQFQVGLLDSVRLAGVLHLELADLGQLFALGDGGVTVNKFDARPNKISISFS